MAMKVTHKIDWPEASRPPMATATMHARKSAPAPATSPAKGKGFARWDKAKHHAASVRGGKALVASGKQRKIRRGKEARELGRLGGLARARNAGQKIHKTT